MSCGTDPTGTGPAGVDGAGSEPAARPSSCTNNGAPEPTRKTTTDGAVAIGNLDSQVDGYTQALEQRPENPTFTRFLVDRLLTRAHFLGSPNDLREARARTLDALEAHPDDPALHLLHARVATAFHHFEVARDAVDQAIAAGAAVGEADARRTILALATGDVEQALRDSEASAEARGGFEALSAYAGALAAAGRFQEADQAFVAAAEAYRDVSPFPLAWLDFQRGVMWSEQAGRPDLARPLYEAAVERLPIYTVAVVHLSELLLLDGETERAHHLLSVVAESSGDPEPTAVLAESLANRGRADEAAGLAAEAEAGYDAVLADLREAYGAHATEFFMGIGGDPARALALARGDLEARETADSLGLAMEAAMAAGAHDEACSYAERATASLPPSPSLAGVVTDALSSCDSTAPEAWATASACVVEAGSAEIDP